MIKAPAGTVVRPTGDRVREAWMSILLPRIPMANVLDLCCGSGALGLEALSRGADFATFVDSNKVSITALKANVAALDAGSLVEIVHSDAIRFVTKLAPNTYDLAFADPPYASNLAVEIAEQWLKVPFADMLGIEHDSKISLPEGGITRKYGSASITFYE